MEVDINKAKTNLSKLIKTLENKTEKEIIISRDGNPIARLVLINNDVSKRIGIARDDMKDFDLSLEEFDSIPINNFDS